MYKVSDKVVKALHSQDHIKSAKELFDNYWLLRITNCEDEDYSVIVDENESFEICSTGRLGEADMVIWFVNNYAKRK